MEGIYSSETHYNMVEIRGSEFERHEILSYLSVEARYEVT
jgi:hypothetical protein